MKKASAKIRRKVTIKFVNAIRKAAQAEEMRERSMRVRQEKKRREAEVAEKNSK